MIALNRLHNWYDTIFQDILGIRKEHTKYIKPVGIGLLIALISLGSWYFYHQKTKGNEQEAFKVFNDCLHEYEKALEGKTTWQEVDTLCQNGYQRNRSTAIAPYIQAIRVDALLALHQPEQALEQSSLMLSQLKTSSPLYIPYKTKHALLEMDAGSETVRAQGLRNLEQLAHDAKNIYNDVALYYLGLHYFMNNDVQKAKEVWNRLVALGMPEDKQGQSPWAARAKEKLTYL